MGKGRKNLERIETDSETKIKIYSDQNADGRSESVILDLEYIICLHVLRFHF